MVVNLLGDTTSKYIHYLTDRVSFPVYQDTTSLSIWSKLDGRKDDILIYDRCGQLTYHARLPYSKLNYNIVERAIIITFLGYDPCTCTPTTSPAMASNPTTELLTTILFEGDTTEIQIDEEMYKQEKVAEQDIEEEEKE